MGYRRGGLYSYDWLDRLFGFLDAPSAERVLPEFQRLEVGDVIPVGRGDGFPVISSRSARWCWRRGHGVQWVWQSGLSVTKRQTPCSRGLSVRPFSCVTEPAAFIMTRKSAALGSAPRRRTEP
jgi:hypothetical protein